MNRNILAVPFNVLCISLLLSLPAYVREGCGGSSSTLSHHTSWSATIANISLG